MHLVSIDIPTLALCRGLLLMLLSALLWFSMRYDRDVRGPGFWALGFALNGLAILTFLFDQPYLVPILNLTNHLATGLACCALLFGFWRFNLQPPQWGVLGIIAILPLIGLLISNDLGRNALLRVLFTASAQLVFYLALLQLLLKPFRAEIGQLFGWLRVLITLFLVFFAWQYGQIGARYLELQVDTPNVLYSGIFGIVSLMFTLTFAIACIALQLVRISAGFADSAMTDWLTGLLNRRGLSMLAEQDDARRQREDSTSAVICFDIDHFKLVNDRFGHPAGDQVLKMLGNVIRSNIRGHDIAARQGGEEFSVVLVGGDESQAIQVAERIRQDFSTRSLSLGLALEEKLTVSAGVVQVVRDRTILQALDAADIALYAAKRAGRNRVVAGSSLTGASGR